jgi:16S rRNA (cytosine967-C5)-methyltransferase
VTSPGPRRTRHRPSRQGHGGGKARSEAAADPARRAAYDLLRVVHDRGAYANLTLPVLLAERRLAGRDAALATELGYGSLRWTGSLDAVLARAVDRPLDRVDGPVLDLLRLGAYQVLFTRVPPHAAVSATVDLARSALGSGRSGFVNAVLRRVAEHDWDGWLAALGPSYGDPAERLGLEHGYPAWIVRAYADALGAAERGAGGGGLAALLAVDRPPVHLVARPGRVSRDALLAQAREALGGAEGADPLPHSPYGVLLHSGDPRRVPAVRDGRAAVQDEGSQLAAAALAGAPMTGPDARWLDLAAGPGGKAALLAGLAASRGARLVAADVHPHRARLAAQALAGGRAGASAAVVADGRAPAWRDAAFDRVLVDAPCSGLGSLRRRPEARWRKSPADIEALAELQRALLRAALVAVRPGGLVGYVTCSPHLSETRDVVGAVLADGSAEPVDVRPALPGAPELRDGPAVQLWPHRHDTDAMYVALLRRL